MPEDPMGTILSESSGAAGGSGGTDLQGDTRSPGGAVPWQEHPERMGVVVNFSKQLSAKLDRIRLEMKGDARSSRSKLVEAALQLAQEDVQRNGGESKLLKRLNEGSVTRVAGPNERGAFGVQRSVDDPGSLVETTYDEEGAVVDESLVGDVAALPVAVEYVDKESRFVSLAEDELGNIYEQVLDADLNVSSTRFLEDADGGAR